MTIDTSSDAIALLLKRITRLEDERDIANLMSHRAYLHSAGRHDIEVEQLWSTRDDIVFEPEDWGGWTGRQAMLDNYVKGNPFPPTTRGLMIEHTLTTAMIEVADDRQTAKGVWISPGHETIPFENIPRPHWSWGRYGVDFVREDGRWKIWHLHVLTTFRTPYDRSWVDSAVTRPEYFPKEGEAMPGMTPPDREVSYNQAYKPDYLPQYQPVPPEPYRTWSETFSTTDRYDHPITIAGREKGLVPPFKTG